MTNPPERLTGGAGGTSARPAAALTAAVAGAVTALKGALWARRSATRATTWEPAPGREGSAATVLLQLAVWQQQL